MTRTRAYNASLGRFINRDPIKERGGVNLFAYARNNSISRTDALGLYDYDAMETNYFLSLANSDATGNAGMALINIASNSLGRFDFGPQSDKENGEGPENTFCVNGQSLTAHQFGNFIAGYQGALYDLTFGGSGAPGGSALAIVIEAGVIIHERAFIEQDPTISKSFNDPLDTTGIPDILNGAAFAAMQFAQGSADSGSTPVPGNYPHCGCQ